jgi:hypothetical protein
MATDLEQKPRASTPKHESFVEQQIARVRGKVRAQDAGKASLLFLILALAYGLGMALADRAWELSSGLRLAAFGAFAIVGGVLLGWTLLCLIRRVNPYYAARQLENTLPDAKNSLVNWLDLRDENLPPVIHSALGLRAARDLKKADPEQAVTAGPTWILGGILAGLILALLILFIMGPQQFSSLMNRVFIPFRQAGIDTRTTIAMVEPEGGHAVVSPNRAITFRAKIYGPVSAVNQEGAPKLLWRYNQAEPFVPQPLDKDADDTWTWTMPADQVINGGFWYKLSAGDAETPEYQVRISAIPQVRAFTVAYHYRAFERKAEDKMHYPKASFSKLHARRGTEVSLRVQTNCDVREGHLLIDWEKNGSVDLPAQVLPADLGTMVFPKFVLDAPGSFRIVFTSRDGKSNIDQSPYAISVFEEKPAVEILKPGKDVTLPANGTLQLEGVAGSSIGIKSMTLRMKVVKGPEFERKPYRPGKSFKLVDGSYPPVLEYKDFIALDKMKTDKGQPSPLAAGMVLEYHLVAVDSSDYPDPNGTVGTSKSYKITIVDSEADRKKQEQDRQQAEQQQKQHERQQDKSIEQQNEAAKQEQQQSNNSKESKQGQDELKKKEQTAKDEAKRIQEKLDKEKQSQDPKQNQSQNSNNEQGNQPQSKEQQPQAGTGKDGNQPNPQSKDGKSDKQSPQPQQKENKQSGKENSGEKKDGGENGSDKRSGQSKDDGQKPGDNKQKNIEKKGAESKGAGEKSPDAGKPGAGKDESAAGAKDKQAETKAGSSPKDGNQNKGEKAKGKKDEGGGAQEKQVSQAKPGPVDEKRQGHGLAKGPDQKPEPSAKGGAKASPDKNSQAKKSEPGQRPSEAKAPDPKQSKTGQSKDKSFAQGKKNNSTAEKFKEPTPEDIARLAKDLKSGDPKTQQDAENQLRRICKECQNPGSAKAAGEALHANNKAPARAHEGSGEKTADSKDQGDRKEGNTPQGQAKAPPPAAEQGKGKGQGLGEDDPNRGGIAQNKGEMMKPGSWGAGRGGYKSEDKASAPTKEFSNRGGSLTLEDWKKILKDTTPEQRKKARISDDEWRRFARAVQKYEDALGKMAAQAGPKENLVGGNSQLSSTGPAQLQPNSNRKLDPLDYNRALPPPEFREAQRQFTAGQDKKK